MRALRVLLLIALFGALTAGLVMFLPRSQANQARLEWVATAQQFGPVGYRDPAGAVSPDGRWIAYSEGRFLRVRPIGGGPSLDLPAGPAQIRYLAWRPDSRAVATDGDPALGLVLYDLATLTRRALFSAPLTALRQPAWSPDGKTIVALANAREGNELWRYPVSPDQPTIDGSRGERVRSLPGVASFPAWTPAGEVACVIAADGRSRVTIPCGETPLRTTPDRDAYGPIAFSPDGAPGDVGLAGDAGAVDLWAAPVSGRRARRLTSFARDAYGASVAADGAVLVKVQSYRTAVAVADANGGPASALATFQSE